MIMMQTESYMLDTLLCKSLYCRLRIGTIFIFLTSSPPIDILYVLGARRRGFHAVFHLFVLVGSFLQFLSIFFFVL